MWNAWTAPPGALPHDYDPWSCEAHCVRCRELAQDCHCEDEMSEQRSDVRQELAGILRAHARAERGRPRKHWPDCWRAHRDCAMVKAAELLATALTSTSNVFLNEDTDDIDDRTR